MPKENTKIILLNEVKKYRVWESNTFLKGVGSRYIISVMDAKRKYKNYTS